MTRLTPDRYAEIAEVFARVCSMPPSARRDAIARYAARDAALASAVTELLDHDVADDGPPRLGAWTEIRPIVESLQVPNGDPWTGDSRASGARARVSDPPTTDGSDVAALGVARGVVPGYRIQSIIGRGSTGIVAVAEQEATRRLVALKLLHEPIGPDHARSRFAVETELLGRLRHPGIAQCFAAGVVPAPGGDRAWIAMELVRGRSIDAWAEAKERRPHDCVELVQAAAAAIHHAHQRQVVHRDLKPANLLVTEDNRVVIVDFGVAAALDATPSVRAAEAQFIIGSVGYMSPEQARGGAAEVDARADVYGLGAILYAMLAGRPPHDLGASSLPQAIATIGMRPADALPALDGVDADLRAIVHRATAFHPDERYESASSLERDLQAWLDGEPIDARRASLSLRVRRALRRHRGSVAVLVAVAAIVGTATAATVIESRRGLQQDLELMSGLLSLVERFGPDGPVGRAERAAGAGDVGEIATLLSVRAREAHGTMRVPLARLALECASNLIRWTDRPGGIALIEDALPLLDGPDGSPRDALVGRIDLARALREWEDAGESRLLRANEVLAEAIAIGQRHAPVLDDSLWYALTERGFLALDEAEIVGLETDAGGALLETSASMHAAAANLAVATAGRDPQTWAYLAALSDRNAAQLTYAESTRAGRLGDAPRRRALLEQAMRQADDAARRLVASAGELDPAVLDTLALAGRAAFTRLQMDRKSIAPTPRLGLIRAARARLESARRAQERILGLAHDETLRTRGTLARLDEFEVNARRTLGEENGGLSTAETRRLEDLARRAIAEKRAVAEGLAVSLGDRHPSTLNALHALGDTSRELDRHDIAAEAYGAALAGYDEVSGPESYRAMLALVRRAVARSEIDDAAGALGDARAAFERERRGASVRDAWRPRLDALVATEGLSTTFPAPGPASETVSEAGPGAGSASAAKSSDG